MRVWQKPDFYLLIYVKDLHSPRQVPYLTTIGTRLSDVLLPEIRIFDSRGKPLRDPNMYVLEYLCTDSNIITCNDSELIEVVSTKANPAYSHSLEACDLVNIHLVPSVDELLESLKEQLKSQGYDSEKLNMISYDGNNVITTIPKHLSIKIDDELELKVVSPKLVSGSIRLASKSINALHEFVDNLKPTPSTPVSEETQTTANLTPQTPSQTQPTANHNSENFSLTFRFYLPIKRERIDNFCLFIGAFLTLDMLVMTLGLAWLKLIDSMIKNKTNYYLFFRGICYLLASVIVLDTILKKYYKLMVGQFFVEFAFPKIYPELAIDCNDPMIIKAAKMKLAEQSIDFDSLLDAHIIEPLLYEKITVAVVSILPWILRQWSSCIEKRRSALLSSIKKAIDLQYEDLKKKKEAELELEKERAKELELEKERADLAKSNLESFEQIDSTEL